MSVVQIKTRARGTRARASSDGQRQYGLSFTVVTNDLNDGPQTVGAALGLEPFDEYSFGNDFDPLAHAKDIEIRRSTDSPYVWEVDVDFDTHVEDWDENPLNRPTVIDYHFVQFQRPCWQDVNLQGVVNSAGRYFDPPPEIDDSRLVITMTRNEPIFNTALAIAYQDAVNSDPWFGFTTGQVKVNNITGTFRKESGQSFYEVVYEFQVRYEGWQLSILDQGLYQKGSGSKGTPCMDDQTPSQPVTEPVPLDGSGNQLSNPSFSNVVFKTFTVYRQLVFANLGLP